MTPKRTKQSSITSMGFPPLQKTTEMCVDRQIKVLGSYWKGLMSNEEVNSQYLCTVREYHALHKWDAGGTPSQAMELQEMGVDGQGRVVLQLQLLERKKYITSLEKQFQGKACIGLQLDMWTNTDSVEREQYACVIMTTSEKTGDNIKVWFLQVRIQNNIKHIMVRQHGDVPWQESRKQNRLFQQVRGPSGLGHRWVKWTCVE